MAQVPELRRSLHSRRIGASLALLLGVEGQMQSRRLFIMLGLALFTTTLAFADKVTSDYNHLVDFSKYKTFMWVHPPSTPDSFISAPITVPIASLPASR